MPDTRPFGGMSQENTLQTILYYLSVIADKMPRLDANDRLVTNPSEVAPATTPVSGTLTSVGGVTDVLRINTLGNSAATARPLDAAPIHFANAGTMHIYNQIVVS